MKKTTVIEAQIIFALRQADTGVTVADGLPQDGHQRSHLGLLITAGDKIL